MILDDIMDIYAEIKLAGKTADAKLKSPGDEALFDIPDAQKMNALLIKGKGGARYRVDGLHVTREK